MLKYCNNERQLVELVSLYKNVYIFGMGETAQIISRRLKNYGVAYAGFCINNIAPDLSADVYALDDVITSENSFFIIAGEKQIQDEIIACFLKLNISAYVVVSDKLIRVMNRADKKLIKFQTHLVDHCNLNCRGCYHFSPLSKEKYVELDEFAKDFSRLSDLFDGKAEEIWLLGGEPLLHPEINECLEIARNSFPVGLIKVLTNGLLLNVIGEDFYDSLGENDVQLWVTKYPVEFDYEKAERRALQHHISIKYFNKEPVRELGHQPLDLNGKRNSVSNFYNCYRSDECVDLKHGKLFSCFIPAEISPFNDYFNTNLFASDNDGIDIYSVQDADDLLSRLEKPISFCRYCNRNDVAVSGRFPWRSSEYNILEWTE